MGYNVLAKPQLCNVACERATLGAALTYNACLDELTDALFYDGESRAILAVAKAIREEGKEAENAGGEEEYKAEADWYDWEVDYPASHIDNIYDGIGINDRYEFVRELFNPNGNLHEAELLFKRTVDDLNRLSSFKEVLVYTRARFPQWDEYSDEVYRFYMIVRRKFN